MSKRGVTITAALIFFWGLGVFGALAQGNAKEKPWRYDPATVETVKGIVVAATPATFKGGMPERTQFTLKTAREILTVYLGPGWFVEKQGLKIANLDQVQVTGSRIMVQGKPALLAGEVLKGDQVLKLRNAQGQPLWRGSPGP